MRKTFQIFSSLSLFILLVTPASVSADAPLRAAFASVDITPDVKGKKPVFLAGYGHGRVAKGVHDPLMARGLVVEAGGEKIALVSVDLVGLQYPAVKQIRAKLPRYKYVMVSSTHNHEGPDVIGLWGVTPLHCGVDPDYIKLVVERVVKLVRAAEAALAPAEAYYGTATDESLLGDSRLPKVYDGVLRTIRFNHAGTDKPLGVLVQWNCHPEAMGSRNTQVTADFPATTIAELTKRYECPIAYFSGAVGGLMAPPDGLLKNAMGDVLKEGQFEYAEAYGGAVADLAVKAIESGKPIRLAPLRVAAKPIALPLENNFYRAARLAGVLNREARLWTGDAEKIGRVATLADFLRRTAVVTEVAYLQLGELHVACLPGELYPELMYGKFQDPVDPGADFPKAPLEPTVMKSLPGEKLLVFGLANDEIGYIIPKRQWDRKSPYCYGRKKSQYGEINSCGPDVAPIIMKALADRVREAGAK
ncbi:MAG: hypothetical protein IIA67_03285 [Planctomycetes bacterium]|nr:hypothetical protein [Planctomycetota bacterium]